jgi:spore coat protein I
MKGNYGCITDTGRYILQEYNHSEEKMITMSVFYNLLESNGFMADSVIANAQGKYVTVSEDGYTYILKKWFDGTECSNNNEKHIIMAVKNLAAFHNLTENTKEIFGDKKLHPGKNAENIQKRHTEEILRIRNYIRKRKNKNYFEMSLHNIIDEYHRQSLEAMKLLEQSYYKELYSEALENESISHGSYNYHNIIFVENKVVMVNLLKINYGPVIQDLYDFLRKVMEKNGWNIELGEKILEEYSAIRPISVREYEVLKAMLSYPEKFWKIINYYYNSNKAWYSEKNEDKLKQFRKQEDLRRKFIDNI